MIDFPSSPSVGQIFNSGTGPIYVWDGVAWSLTVPNYVSGEEAIGTFDLAGLQFKDITGLSAFRHLNISVEGSLSSVAQLFARVSNDNGSTFLSGAADYANAVFVQAGTSLNGFLPATASTMSMCGGNMDANIFAADFRITNFNKVLSTIHKSDITYVQINQRMEINYGFIAVAAAHNAIRIGITAGTFVNGFLTVKGIRG